MNTATQLVVYLDKEKAAQVLETIPTLTVPPVGLLVIVQLISCSFLGSSWLGFVIFLLTKIVLGLFIMILVVIVAWLKYLVKRDSPLAILNQEGLWLYQFGFIPWEDITEFSAYQALGNTKAGEIIGIRYKNSLKIFRQADWGGKMGIFWAWVFRYHHARLAGIDIPNEEVVSFAQKYLKK